MVSNIRATISPTRQTSRHFVLKIFFVHALPKLETSSHDFSDVLFDGLRLKVKR
jgi:hypothetical protein